MSICPILTKDFEKDPKPCYDGCEWKVKGHCAINVIAQTQYQSYMDSRKNPKDQEKA